MEKYEALLKKYKQDHVIPYLNDEIKKQLDDMDFCEMEELFNQAKRGINVETGNIEPIKAINPSNLQEEEKNKAYGIGEKIIKENKFAIVTMAGGQGTRLRT